MDLSDAFDAATERATSLPHQSNDVLLELYGLYKQATRGDVVGDRPGAFDFKGAAKYDAWEKRRGMSRDEARQAYIALVDRLAEG
ncbi:MAG: acyl-CoA-binding protein [Holophagae bacterium]|jgi:acyl-CoA-binding protein